MLLAKELGAHHLLVNRDSLLVTGQVSSEYQAKDPQLASYLRYVKILRVAFSTFDLVHVLREQNSWADLLSRLANSGKGGRHRYVIQETLRSPKTTIQGPPEDDHVEIMQISAVDTWLTSYVRYLTDGLLPSEPTEAKITKKNASRYTLVDGHLLWYGYTYPLLTCVSGYQCMRIMLELHESICVSYIGGLSLFLKVIRARYYWPTMKEDCVKYVKRCEQCQKHVD